VEARIVRGCITAAGEDVPALALSVGGQINGRSYSVARALGTPYELQLYPVMSVCRYVAEQGRVTIEDVDDHVKLAVVEEIADRQAS
jgi:hypothetical protein